MEFQPGKLTLTDIAGGTLSTGVIPFQRFQSEWEEVENAGLVTVLNTSTALNSAPEVDVALGDYVIVIARMDMLKGGFGGISEHFVAKSAGTSVLNWMLSSWSPINEVPFHDPNKGWQDLLVAMFRCTTAGTATLTQYGKSIGSNGTVIAGAAGLQVWVIPSE